MIKPIRANFEITNKCNLRCKHCYFFNNPTLNKCLPEPVILKIVKKLINEGILELSIGGGEPFCFEKIKELLRLATKKIYVIVSSNGLLINDSIIEFLSKLGNFTLQISLDGNENHHCKIRGITPEQYKKLLRIIIKCSNRLNLQLGFMLSHINYRDLESMIQFCILNKIKKLVILPYLGANKLFILTDEERKISERTIKKYHNHLSIYVRDPEMSNDIFKNQAECEAGKSSFNIDSNGYVSACSYYESLLGNIRKINISDIPFIFHHKYKKINRHHCLAKDY